MTKAQQTEVVGELCDMQARITMAFRDAQIAQAARQRNDIDTDEWMQAIDLMHGYEAERDGAIKMLQAVADPKVVAMLRDQANLDARSGMRFDAPDYPRRDA